MINGIHHVAIVASNYQRSKDFYIRILGCTLIEESYRAERQSYKLDLAVPGGGQIELFSFPEPPARPSQPEACGLRHLAFRVADLDAAARHLVQNGVAVEPIRTDHLTGKRLFFFADPDRLPLEFYEM